MSEPETQAGRALIAAWRHVSVPWMEQQVATIEAELRAYLAARLDTPPTSLSESAAFGWELARLRLIEGSDPASPPCKECGEAQAAPQHDPETILDPGTVGHEVHVYFPVREGSDPASPEVTTCTLGGVHEHTFRGPHQFAEWDPASPEAALDEASFKAGVRTAHSLMRGLE